MARTPEALVEPALLKWARESLCLSVDDAANRVGVDPRRLEAWESGATRPSVAQLDHIAHAYKRPPGVFYLAVPPAEPATPPDFRSAPGRRISPELAYELRRARERRDIARELAEAEPRPFVLTASRTEDPEVVALRARAAFGVTVQEQTEWRHAALARWKESVEALDVLVFETDGVSTEEMRGFSLYAPVLPAIALNGKDSRSGRTFTLAHEFVHLMLGAAGICSQVDDEEPPASGQATTATILETERFCNSVAARILVPGADLAQVVNATYRRSLSQDLSGVTRALATRYAASEHMVVWRLAEVGAISHSAARREQALLHARYQAQQRRQEEREQDHPREVKIPYFRRVLKWNGQRYTQSVLRAYEHETISPVQASRYLGAKLQHFDALMQHAWAR